MSILQGLKPERVFYYFEEITKIPHGSGNTKEISDYLVSFAKEHNLKYIQDASNNVIIFKDASEGYEQAPTVILQGHCDMVAEKAVNSSFDFKKDALQLEVNGDFISAKDTTLGADDGIAVAFALAVLESKEYKHPALEVVITTDEEIGLLGATAIDCSQLKGKYFLNMDSEEEGFLWVGCAGGLTSKTSIPVNYFEASGLAVELVIDGLVGGHSGAEIDKNRANSNILMGRFLYTLSQKVDYVLAELEGGLKDNAIPRSTRALVLIQEIDKEEVTKACEMLQADLRKEYSGSDEGICVTAKFLGEQAHPVLKPSDKEKVIFYLMNVANGIQKMSGQINGLVETSLNLGILKLDPKVCFGSQSVRSSVGSAKDALTDRVRYITEFLGGTFETVGEYPAWEYAKESKLRDLMVEVYQGLFNEKPVVKAIHAGLECGLFYDKIPGLDCVSFGPTMHNIHTTEEELSISSTERMWNYLLKILEAIH